jgi:hypothetical protein
MTDSKDELRRRFDTARDEESPETPDNQESTANQTQSGDASNAGNTSDGYDWGDKYNYPFYLPREFAEQLDTLYNQYDGKNKVEGGDGLEKHREFLFPIMETAIEELDLEEVIDWEATEKE